MSCRLCNLAWVWVFVVGLTLVSSSVAEAQGNLEAKKAKKLESGFLKNGKWFTDYQEALAESQKTGKVIFAYFTRSYSP